MWLGSHSVIGQSTYRVVSHSTWLTQHLRRPMRKRVFDASMPEQLGTLIFMTEMDSIVIGASREAAGGRRDLHAREITSPGCHIGTSEAASMRHGHA